MMFYDEAVAELDDALVDGPDAPGGWLREVGPGGAADWVHEISETRLRILDNGTVVVINRRLLAEEMLRYVEMLRKVESTASLAEFAMALATRNKQVLLDWVGPQGLKVG